MGKIRLVKPTLELEKEALESVEKNNVASIKTIEKNGGNYCRSFTFENEEAYVYLINL